MELLKINVLGGGAHEKKLVGAESVIKLNALSSLVATEAVSVTSFDETVTNML